MTRADHPPAWSVRCPWCNAAVGARCTRPTGGRLSIPSHDARIHAWNAQQTKETQ